MAATSVIRVEKTKNYTVMSNYHLRDSNLSLKAKGLMSIMLSLPDDWDYSIPGLAAICKEGIDAIKHTLTELENAGYIARQRLRNEKGHLLGVEYTIYENPSDNMVKENPKVENPLLDKTEENPKVEKPPVEKPPVEKPSVDFPLQLNTNNINILNKQNTDYINPSVSVIDVMEQLGCTEEDVNGNDRLNGLIDIITDVLNSNRPFYINGIQRSADCVHKQFHKLKIVHLKYVLDSIEKSTMPVKNYRGYLITALYNAPLMYDCAKKTGMHNNAQNYKKQGNKFHNFEQRDADYEDMKIDISNY